MLQFLQNFFTEASFIPHGHCYLWQPSLVWLNIVSDSVIALVYYSIPAILIYFAHKRKDFPFKWILVLFGAFIISCGTTHIMDIWTLWHPTYWVSSFIKVITAIVSAYTAVALLPIIPQALALPSPSQLEAANFQLKLTLQELSSTQTQLIQTEKMSSLGQLVAGIAHEINNPINFIYGNTSLVDEYTENLLDVIALYQKNYPLPVAEIQALTEKIDLDFIQDDLPKILSSMKMGADRIRNIVLSLRNFSRLDEAEIKKVDIHEGIDSTLVILQNRLQGKGNYPEIHVIKEYGNLPKVECYPRQLNQVFLNILNNAIDALEESVVSQRSLGGSHATSFNGGNPHKQLVNSEGVSGKTTDNAQLTIDKLQICIRTEVVDSNQVMIRIADNGYGMTEAVKQKIFEPFFTTKPVGSGTGLGLAISYQIVSKHGGLLNCISAPLQGTEFLIQIPTQLKLS
ncbi:HAMP domain-containing histidine kinase [Nostoc sp. CENA67]|uniref:histidine kinase n=1 Tax=Amazonocrinis nigriterrae CENA67 TaxID=2794033 RepID=A0A8J7HR94_9NOST|nr:ATP-binding protein [Amazonocrinis nigriterrae]MBH8562263.1 HAMP domain-containing histidine kinase [Amazonocrinis nigriterrae CENA67]